MDHGHCKFGFTIFVVVLLQAYTSTLHNNTWFFIKEDLINIKLDCKCHLLSDTAFTDALDYAIFIVESDRLSTGIERTGLVPTEVLK